MKDTNLREIMGEAYRLLEHVEEPKVDGNEDERAQWWKDAYGKVDAFNQKWNREPYGILAQDLSTAFYRFAEKRFKEEKMKLEGEQQRMV